jgi:hypothetical protein
VTLLSRLRAVVADDREIEALVEAAAGGGAVYGTSGAVDYLCGDKKHTVFAHARFKNGRVSSLEPGPALKSSRSQEAFLQRAATDSAHSHGTIVSSRVLFAERPLSGAFTWADRLRISPCPKRARIRRGLDWAAGHTLPGNTPRHLGPPYPFLLEVRSFRSPNAFLQTNRALRELDTAQYLLTVLLHGRLQYAHHSSERVWVSVKRRARIDYHLLHQGFDAGVPGETSDFPTRRVPRAPVYSGPDYYNHLWPRDPELLIPSTLDQDLNFFNGLTPERQKQFVRASYWYSLGIQFAGEPSLSTVAHATAIECLLPRPSTARCDACGKPAGHGPTYWFNQHLRRYAPIPSSLTSQKAAFYAARSALVHGTHADRADSDAFSIARRSIDPLLVAILSQRSLVGWLRDNDKVVQDSGSKSGAAFAAGSTAPSGCALRSNAERQRKAAPLTAADRA